MKTILLVRRLALLLPLLCLSLLAQASHFRFGSITYQTSGANDRVVTFRVTEAWRNDAFGAPPVLGQVVNVGASLLFGDGSNSPINITVTTVGPGYFYGEAIIVHTYAASGAFTAFTTSCCRISNLRNNPDGDFYVSTPVVVGNANDSPVSTLLPIVNLPTGQAGASYTLPATDPNGNPLTYSAATSADLGGIAFTNAPGLVVNSATGQVTFSTVGRAIGQLYNAVVKVSDGSTSIILDHIIQISNVASNAAPVFTAPTPANGTVYSINPGQLLTFTVRATDADAGDNIVLQALGAPAGASSVPALPTTGNPVQTVFSFTPTAAQIGSYVVSFIAQDNSGVQTTSSVTIQVQAGNTAPSVPIDANPAPNSVPENSANGTLVGLTVSATDPQGTALTYSLTDNAGGRFAINATTGVVSVANGTLLNYEANTSHAITAQASDGTLTSSQTFTIQVTDVNETPVIAAQTFTAAENSPNGTVVGTVAASDPDAGQTLSYSITAGNTGGAFTFVGNQLRVANSAALIFAVTPTFSLTVRVADSGAPQLSATATVTVNLTPATTGVVYRINAGGPQVVNSIGTFAADQYYSTPSRTYSNAAAIAGTTDDTMYQTERFEGVFGYALPVPNGQYSVVLHFAEIYWTQPGQRIFDVRAEGNLALNNYDIVAKVGPLTATTETLAVTVTDGVLNLDFSALAIVGGTDAAKVSAIEVLTQGPSSPAYRLNAGGPQVVNSIGTFAADQYYSTPSRTYSNAAAIAGTTDDTMYQTERFEGVFGYALPVPNGTYSVVLHFAEIYWTQPGQRIFDVRAEGNLALNDYDIVAKVGPLTATTETLLVTVTDGVLNLDFSALAIVGGTDAAKVSAIEVLALAARPGAAALLASSAVRTKVASLMQAAPNPFTDQVRLDFQLLRPEAYSLTVYDLAGRELTKVAGGPTPAEVRQHVALPLSAYPAGVYLVRLNTASGSQQVRIVKQ